MERLSGAKRNRSGVDVQVPQRGRRGPRSGRGGERLHLPHHHLANPAREGTPEAGPSPEGARMTKTQPSPKARVGRAYPDETLRAATHPTRQTILKTLQESDRSRTDLDRLRG